MLQSEMERNVQVAEDTDHEAMKLIGILNKVSGRETGLEKSSTQCVPQVLKKWEQMPSDDMQSWTLQAAESAGSKA